MTARPCGAYYAVLCASAFIASAVVTGVVIVGIEWALAAHRAGGRR